MMPTRRLAVPLCCAQSLKAQGRLSLDKVLDLKEQVGVAGQTNTSRSLLGLLQMNSSSAVCLAHWNSTAAPQVAWELSSLLECLLPQATPASSLPPSHPAIRYPPPPAQGVDVAALLGDDVRQQLYRAEVRGRPRWPGAVLCALKALHCPAWRQGHVAELAADCTLLPPLPSPPCRWLSACPTAPATSLRSACCRCAGWANSAARSAAGAAFPHEPRMPWPGACAAL